MADLQNDKTLTLAQQYHLKDKEEKPNAVTKPFEAQTVENPEKASSEKVASKKVKEAAAAVAEENSEVAPAAEDIASPAAEDSGDSALPASEDTSEAAPPVTEESSETPEEESSGDQEVTEEAPEIKLETAPADFRFPTTNQTRHCFTRYIEYHRCIAAKGEGAPECDRFSKYYRALCPGEWVDRWNEQRENGTFPGPL
ncbi:COX6B domain-containing protein [Cephalotus follicularis]|uniref:COX6B domain-containing protein n=1 Tax=Cephalotus follicularis TaxID=3775 RepID=A0A1Q3CSN5_CEPFO|nr:COX6B domain-containing protein [Cephalotus follicularis]